MLILLVFRLSECMWALVSKNSPDFDSVLLTRNCFINLSFLILEQWTAAEGDPLSQQEHVGIWPGSAREEREVWERETGTHRAEQTAQEGERPGVCLSVAGFTFVYRVLAWNLLPNGAKPSVKGLARTRPSAVSSFSVYVSYSHCCPIFQTSSHLLVIRPFFMITMDITSHCTLLLSYSYGYLPTKCTCIVNLPTLM